MLFSRSPKDKSLISKHDKLQPRSSRLLSKDTFQQDCPSFRVYYGAAPASVPFVWESQPGTPKQQHSIPSSPLPPLTPPPSHYFHTNSKSTTSTKPSKLRTLFKAIPLFKLTLRKRNKPPISPTVSSWSSSSSSSISSFSVSSFSSSRSLFACRDDEVCANAAAVRRCNSMVIVKNAFLSMFGHGSD